MKSICKNSEETLFTYKTFIDEEKFFRFSLFHKKINESLNSKILLD